MVGSTRGVGLRGLDNTCNYMSMIGVGSQGSSGVVGHWYVSTDAGGHSLWQQGARTSSPSQLMRRTWPSSPRGSVPVRHAFVHVVEQRSDSASRRAWTQAPSGGQTEQWLNPAPRTLTIHDPQGSMEPSTRRHQ